MFTIDSVLIYRSRVCKVLDIREETFGKTKKMYYILVPVFDDKNTIYVPLDNAELTNKMKKVLTEKEILSLIQSVKEKPIVWIDDNKERPVKFKEILENSERDEIILVIKALKKHRDKLATLGRVLHSSDEMLLQRAEKRIYDEFAYVLGIEPKKVEEFLKSKNASF